MISSDPKLPNLLPNEEFSGVFWRRFSERFYRLWRELADSIKTLEETILNSPVLKVPTVSIDVGSAEFAASGGAACYTVFTNQYLPTTATSTSSTLANAVSYTGAGILHRVVGCSQVSGGASTAAGMNIKITIDGTVVYTNATALTAVNRIRTIVGSQSFVNTADEKLDTEDDPNGLPFKESCLIEFASGTNGQGVSIGWRILKKE